MTPEWDVEQLYFSGDEYFADLLSAIQGANRTIDLETYIFNVDPLGRRFETALAQASARGVKVRLLVDGIGASGWLDKISPDLLSSVSMIRVYHPVAWGKVFKRYFSRMEFLRNAQSRNWISRLNRRNHRKVCIVDGKSAWVGSFNISGVHSGEISGNFSWRDTGVKIQGQGIEDLVVAFEHAWLRSTSLEGKRKWRETLLNENSRKRPSSPLLRLNFMVRTRRKNYFDLANRIRKAKKRIWVTNAYLSPTAPLIRHLAKAARKGVDVRLLVPRHSDVFFMPWVIPLNYEPLLRSKVRIYEYLPRFLHAKSMIIDDWAITGTSNLNRRSILFDFEVDVVLSKEVSILKLEEQFLLDLQESEEILAAQKGLKAFLGRIFALLLRNWI